jgi:hypothetical protein
MEGLAERILADNTRGVLVLSDIPRIRSRRAQLFASSRRAATKFDRSRPADSQSGETLSLAGSEPAAFP